MGVAAVVLGAGDGETIAKAVELLGVDTVNGETPLQQGIDDRPMRDLDGDGNPLRHKAATFFVSHAHNPRHTRPALPRCGRTTFQRR